MKDIKNYNIQGNNRCNNYVSQLLNVHNVTDVRRIKIHTAEPLVPVPSHLEAEITIAKLKKYKLTGSDEIPAGGEILVSVIHKLINSIWNNEELLYQWKESLSVPVHKNDDKTDCIIMGYHCSHLHTKFY
jgi:hypothetical protein